jgi:glycosyltransferase 2 family protein
VVVGLAAGIWLVGLFLKSRGFDWRAFRATLLALKWWWLAAATGSLMAGYYGRALRWRVLMRPVKADPSIWNLFSATLIGFSAITVLGRPGEFVRPYLIAAKERVSASSQMAALILERICDVLIVLAIFGFALSRVRRSDATLGPALSWVFATGGWFVGALSILVLGLLVVFRHFSAALRRRLLGALTALGAAPQLFKRADRLITAFALGMESIKSQKAMLVLVWYTVLEWVTIALTTFCVMRAFGGRLHFGWLDVLIFLGFLAFGAVVQIPGVGGGMQVVSVLVLTELFRVPLEISTSVALVLWFISFVVVVPLGVALALHEGIHWRTLKQLEPEISL